MYSKQERTHNLGFKIKLNAIKNKGRSLSPKDAQHLTISKEFLSYLIKEKQFEIFQTCYEAQTKNFKWRADENTLLFDAIDNNAEALVDYILKEAQNKTDKENFITFITTKRPQADKTLPFDKETPLMVAASRGNLTIFKLLIESGANIILSNEKRKSTIDITYLIFLKADDEKGIPHGAIEYPIFRAIANNQQKIVRYFLQNLEKHELALMSLLVETIFQGRALLYQLLIQEGAKLPGKFNRKLYLNGAFISSMTLTSPTPFCIFLTGASFLRKMNEAEQKDLAQYFYEQSSSKEDLSMEVIKKAFSTHYDRPYVLIYAIEKFLLSVKDENIKLNRLKTFLCWSVQELSDECILDALKGKNLNILTWKIENLSLRSIMRKHIEEYDNLDLNDCLRFKRLLKKMLTWSNELLQNENDRPQTRFFKKQSPKRIAEIESLQALLQNLLEQIEIKDLEEIEITEVFSNTLQIMN